VKRGSGAEKNEMVREIGDRWDTRREKGIKVDMYILTAIERRCTKYRMLEAK
jgi:hypothetical protein